MICDVSEAVLPSWGCSYANEDKRTTEDNFCQSILNDHPTANTKKVNESWSAAGMEGTISETLVNKMRSQMGLTGNLRGKDGTKSEAAAGTKRAYTGKRRGRKPKQEIVVIAELKAAPTGRASGQAD